MSTIWKKRLRELHLAFVFFTRIPLPNLGRTPVELRNTLWAWPLVGMLIGLIAGTVFIIFGSFLGFNIAATITIIMTIFITGAFHEDGLAGCTDSFGAFDPKRRLEIMKDSNIGTYGVLALIAAFSLRVFALIELSEKITGIEIVLAFMLIYLTSRLAIIGVFVGFSPIEGQGLREQVTNIPRYQFVATYSIALIIMIPLMVSLGLGVLNCAVFLIAGLILPNIFVIVMKKRIGGFNGDVLGGVCVLSEVLALITIGSIINYLP